jgi:hypothetical protein
MANFDDLDWPSAIEHDTNSHTDLVLPWGQKLDIAESAKFIWTADANNDMEVYCRRSLVTRCSESKLNIYTFYGLLQSFYSLTSSKNDKTIQVLSRVAIVKTLSKFTLDDVEPCFV